MVNICNSVKVVYPLTHSASVKGDEITNAQTYAMGAPIYFEAKQSEKTGDSGDQRIYINKCFMTASPNPNSSPKYAVIDNQG